MTEKIYRDDIKFALREVVVNGKREYILLVNLGMSEFRFDADKFDKMIVENRESLSRGDTIYFPPPYNWR